MSMTIRLVDDLDYANVVINPAVEGQENRSRPLLNEARWTNRQVIAACLWAALIGLGCGYGWLLLQMGAATC